jgi:hypothetical protein
MLARAHDPAVQRVPLEALAALARSTMAGSDGRRLRKGLLGEAATCTAS